MVSPEEKREFIKLLIELAAQPDCIAQAEESLHQLLLRDTNNEKSRLEQAHSYLFTNK